MDTTGWTADQFLRALKVHQPGGPSQIELRNIAPQRSATESTADKLGRNPAGGPACSVTLAGWASWPITPRQMDELQKEALADARDRMSKLFWGQHRLRHEPDGSCAVEILDTRGDLRAGKIPRKEATGKSFEEAINNLVKTAREYALPVEEQFEKGAP